MQRQRPGGEAERENHRENEEDPGGAITGLAYHDEGVQYIEVFYSRQRLHSVLDYRTPAEALAQYQFRTAA